MTSPRATATALLPSVPLSFLFSPHSNPPSGHFLPSFQRFCLVGPFPPSSLFHLAFSYTNYLLQNPIHASGCLKSEETIQDIQLETEASQSPYTLVLTPSRESLHNSLVEENESFLAIHGGDSNVSRIFQENVEIKYLDSVKRWKFFLAACHSGSSENGAGNGVPPQLKIRRKPDLVIVWGLGEYLTDPNPDIASYSCLLASLFSTFDDACTRIVVFDNPLDEHRLLPLLPRHLNQRRKPMANPSPDKKKSDSNTFREGAIQGNGSEQESSIQPVRRMSLIKACEYFCEAVGTVTQLETPPPSLLAAAATAGTREGNDEMGEEEEAEVAFYELRVWRSPRLSDKGGKAQEECVVAYMVQAGQDEEGYSGRRRLRVRFE